MTIKRKIAVVTGTRAEYGLLKPVLFEISKSKKLDLFLIVTGMHLSTKYGLSINEIKSDGFKIYKKIEMLPKGNTNFSMSIALGEGIVKFSKIFKKLKPNIILVLGDRDEILASALAGSHMNVPIGHIHGGEKTKAGIDENNRHTITKLSNIHFAATEKSKKRIIKMGENPKYVFFTGSPGIDDIFKKNITSRNQLEKKYSINFNDKIILLVQHPVTTQSGQRNRQIKATLDAIVKNRIHTMAIAPNSDAGNKEIFSTLNNYAKKYSFIKIYPTIPRRDYLGFLQNSSLLLGNSSSGIIEASYFNIPVINLGIRQENRETEKNIIKIPDFNSKKIFDMIKKITKHPTTKFKKQSHYLYGNGNSSKKINRILENIKIDNELIQKQIFN